MAQLTSQQCLLRAIKGEQDPAVCLLDLIDRKTGQIRTGEGLYVDFKKEAFRSENSAAEIARDILAFSNTEGGLIIFGISDYGVAVGHDPVDPKVLRERVGPYAGTRVDYETAVARAVINGSEVPLAVIVIRRSTGAFPNLLRRHIEISGKFGRKVKYVAGSLFYRDDAQTLVEPTGGDIEARAVELGFTGASPRTRSSFLTKEDRPGVRLYAHINDRFFGRNAETTNLLSKFDDPRGRGISIAGQGGIGKTELAIEISTRLFATGKFKSIYSASAKKTLLGPTGTQYIDPSFYDYPTFLRDLTAWLGFDAPQAAPVQELEQLCLAELAGKQRTLLFVDNLETIEDGRVFEFLDRKVPANVWLLVTSRVHKIKNYVYSLELGALDKRDAAHLLRYELKRFGLQDLASTDIQVLEDHADKLYRHPLGIRWYAWACRKTPEVWHKSPTGISKEELESFCVGHTLQSLPSQALKVLAAIATTAGHTEITPGCVRAISEVSGSHLEVSLYELECAGLVSVLVNDQTGQLIYSIAPLAINPARELARIHHWEKGFTSNLHEYLEEGPVTAPEDPLLTYLLQIDPRTFGSMPPEEVDEIKKRIERANKRSHSFKIDLLYLAAECERHSGNIITSDDIYHQAADLIVASGKVGQKQKYQTILLEAATVARQRSHTDQQLRRAIDYLESIKTSQYAPLRVLGSLVETYAILGDQAKYNESLKNVHNLRDAQFGRFSQRQLLSLEEALGRARSYMESKGAPKAHGAKHAAKA